MKKNLLRQGLKHDKKLKDSFYFFIVDNKIDWAIIISCILCSLPYLGSKIWYFIIIKSIILMTIIFIALNYLKQWKKLNELDQLYNKASAGFKNLIAKNKSASLKEKQNFITELTRKINSINEEILESNTYKSLKDYLNSDEERCLDLKNFLNENKKIADAAIGTYSSILTGVLLLREIPTLKFQQYYKLMGVILLTVLFFVVYSVETSL